MEDEVLIKKLGDYFGDKKVSAAYLFGSVAKGKDNRLSDADVGILFDEGVTEQERFRLKLEMAGDLPRFFEKERVDVVDIERTPLNFRYKIIKPKKILYCKNKKRRVDFEYEVVDRYLDIKPSLMYIAKRQLEIMAQGDLNE